MQSKGQVMDSGVIAMIAKRLFSSCFPDRHGLWLCANRRSSSPACCLLKTKVVNCVIFDCLLLTLSLLSSWQFKGACSFWVSWASVLKEESLILCSASIPIGTLGSPVRRVLACEDDQLVVLLKDHGHRRVTNPTMYPTNMSPQLIQSWTAQVGATGNLAL